MASALVLADRFGDNDEVEKGGGLYKIVCPKSTRARRVSLETGPVAIYFYSFTRYVYILPPSCLKWGFSPDCDLRLRVERGVSPSLSSCSCARALLRLTGLSSPSSGTCSSSQHTMQCETLSNRMPDWLEPWSEPSVSLSVITLLSPDGEDTLKALFLSHVSLGMWTPGSSRCRPERTNWRTVGRACAKR